ncbi:MAG: tetratricopeptide repeat protein, partial [Candidatus Limnocylindria bacterium]
MPAHDHFPTRLVAISLALALAIGLGTWFTISLLGSAETAPAVAQLRAAAEQRAFGSTDQLISDTQAKVDAAPEDADAHAVLGAAYLQLARETGDPANYGRAEASLDRAIELDPDNLQALIAQGSLSLSRHEFDEALRLGERALAINDTIPRVYGLIGDAEVELGRYEAAVRTIQTMVDLRPDLASYSRVAYLRELHGDLSGAIDAMQQAVAAGGGNVENTEYVRVQLGNLHFAVGDLTAAERSYAESLAHLADYPYALAGMARVRAAQGDVPEAIELFERASARIPVPEFIIGLGETLEAAGRADEAADQYALV